MIITIKIPKKNIIGVTIWPFIFIEPEYSESTVLINHEKIHLRQQLELLILPFYIIYGIEYVWKYFKHRSWDEAYKHISFEKEAYSNEHIPQYLEKRKAYGWFKYL